jgi:two-component system response regulator NreC
MKLEARELTICPLRESRDGGHRSVGIPGGQVRQARAKRLLDVIERPDGTADREPSLRARQGTVRRLLIVDCQPVVCLGLRLLLETEPGIDVVAEASSVHEALCESRAGHPHVAVLDPLLADGSGLETIELLLSESPKLRILVLTAEDHPQSVRDAFAAGACGYITKEASEAELREAIHTVSAGRRYLQPSLGVKLVSAAAQESRSTSCRLSASELTLLRLLAHGHTNDEIAGALGCCLRTIEGRRAGIVQKLGTRSRAELVKCALDYGLLKESKSWGSLVPTGCSTPPLRSWSAETCYTPWERGTLEALPIAGTAGMEQRSA